MPQPRFTPRERIPGTHCTGGYFVYTKYNYNRKIWYHEVRLCYFRHELATGSILFVLSREILTVNSITCRFKNLHRESYKRPGVVIYFHTENKMFVRLIELVPELWIEILWGDMTLHKCQVPRRLLGIWTRAWIEDCCLLGCSTV
jgi:hypothetical protein